MLYGRCFQFFVSCLTWAAGRGHTDIVEALLAHGAKVNTTDKVNMCHKISLLQTLIIVNNSNMMLQLSW